jgi:ribonucleoside-diphosphate reductase alpha chain
MALPKTVIKRDQSKQPFEKEKIIRSIRTASHNVGKKNGEFSLNIATKVIEYIEEIYSTRKPIKTSDIGSAVERILVTTGEYEIVKEFILSREARRQEFLKKQELGVEDDIGHLKYNSLFILKERYLKQDENGNTIETPKGMLKRVAKAVAKAEKTPKLRKKWEKEFLELMRRWEFLPGTRVLANAGKKQQQMGNCFVFNIEDTVDSIFKALHESSVTKKHGGGCGYNFSKIRPKGDLVGDEPGLASGPVQIMQMFDLPTSIFRQQGKYESGNMSVLNTDHPDILEFITCKEKDGILSKTNISLGASDKFMNAVKKNKTWELVNPRNGKVENKIKARALFELASTFAHKTGDPGMLFLDHMNRDNPLKKAFGQINATNVCGEIPQYPYESCNLGYLNLNVFVEKNSPKAKINFDRLASASKLATRFMDDVIEVSWFPIPEQMEMIKKMRRIGIGVVGWAEVLVDLGIPYTDPESFKLAEKVMKTIADACHEESLKLGKEKGPFKHITKSAWNRRKNKPRNVATNTLPPSSGNAVIFETSFSVEPFFGLAFYQNVLGGIRIKNVNHKLDKILKREGIRIDNLFERIFENHGSIQGIKKIPTRIRKLFLTAHEIKWQDHLKMQAAWQKYTDNAITKTINMPSSATVDDVEKAYMMAWELGCKGITIYRDQSKKDQVIEFGDQKKSFDKAQDTGIKNKAQAKAGDACPECGEAMVAMEGCVKCTSCSFSYCEI